MRTTCKPGKKSIFFLAVLLPAFALAQYSPSSAKQKAADLLKKNIIVSGLNQSMLSSYRITDAYADKHSGNFLVYLQQTRLNIPVYNKISVYVFRNDSLLEKRLDFIGRMPDSAIQPALYSVQPMQAVRMAANHLSIPVRQEPRLLRKDILQKKFVYSVAGLPQDSVTSELVWLPVDDGRELKLAWNVRMASPDGRNDWFVRVDAQTGDYLEKNSLVLSEQPAGECDDEPAMAAVALPKTAEGIVRGTFSATAVSSATYRVYPFPLESPNFGSRVLESDPWLKASAGNNAGTLGWHSDNSTNYDNTRGNNVWAQEDMAGSSSTSGITDISTTPNPALTFDRTLDPSLNPGTSSNLRAGIDNLFYWNNIMHDISYQYGFDEAAGNFQANNLGRGGIGDDYVNAFAEDGAGLNNADFGTPPEGENPRMRMYQWNLAVTHAFQVNNPAAIAGSYPIVESSLNLNNQLGYTGPKTANIIQADDGGSTHLGCGVLVNAASLANNIAMIDRGVCGFTQKITNAQNAGAIAVIIVNNVAGPATGIGGSDISISIPAVMISMADGAILKANLAGLNGSLSASGLFKDGALDNGIIAHEYSHGISNRLTGGPANVGCLVNAEQMGEGWSDYLALMVTTNWASASITDGANPKALATYAASQPANGAGIRHYPYSTNMAVNPWTYDMLKTSTGGEVHSVGEIWCASIWDMTWNIIQQEGINSDIYHGTGGNNIALRLVMEGMKYQPCSPGFLDGRDAILKADSILYNYAHKCAIWNAFARRGMGKSAVQGSSNSYTDQVGATDLPLGLGLSKTADKSSLLNGDLITYTIKATCDCGSLTNVSIVDTLSKKLSYTASSGGSYTDPFVHFDGIDFAPGETKTFTIQAKVTGSYASPVTLIDDSRDPDNYSWTPAVITGGTSWVESAARSHSSSHAWFAADGGSSTDFSITSGDVVLDTISTLSFWHYFETEPSFDGGLLEISTNGGATWRDLGPYITQNAYNSSLDPTSVSSSVANRRAFSGSSGGNFIQTVVSLTDFAGLTARIRFRFASDGAVGSEGWYIDDIVLKNEKGIANKAYAFNGASLLSRNNTYSLFSAVALPVHFISFEAQKQNNTALLHWKVNNETNVDKYIIERSADGKSFTSIGERVQLAGSGEKDYYFSDNQPLSGNDFYRIAEKDLDGGSMLSSNRLLRFTTAGTSVRLLPVPTYNHSVQLEIENGPEGSYNAYLLNAVGQTVKAFSVKTGINQLDLQGFAKGVYYIKLQLRGGRPELRKLVID